ncbi:oxidoreductase [Streptomyces sp. SL13]|uniref:Oxidoreductase n=1 Tax=Streptantibioticus silvisoli TaxID=2705255 RepID=A0AA90KH12_9ACTN|nr:oxidoreductase [Streptantibioticus silvisoli]MDI5970889.1 oxidoreductase [Streptantibioticus silvisoli]
MTQPPGTHAAVDHRELAGRRALVTGATRGLGAAIAARLEAVGARVVTSARHAADGPVAGTFVQADVSTADGVRRLAEAALDHLGGVDVLVDNAGAQTRVPDGVLALTDEDWLNDLSGSLLSAVRLDRALLPGMFARGHGSVIHIGSNAARWPQPAAVAYAAAKAALHAYSKGLANEAAPHGVRVNVVSPGVIETSGLTQRLAALAAEHGGDLDAARAEFARTFAIPLGRPGTPEDIAETVAFLASDRARYTTGTVQVVDGGLLSTL